MRIVAVSDTHLFHEELVLPPGDILVHAGDMCRGGTQEELGRAAAWLRSLPFGGRAGCVELRARVREVRPKLHLFGHIHDDGGLWHDGGTCFANVTTWECERPPIV